MNQNRNLPLRSGLPKHRGFVLVVVLVLLLSFAVFAILVLFLTRSQRSMDGMIAHGKRAQLALDSALESAEAELIFALESDSVIVAAAENEFEQHLFASWFWDAQSQDWRAQALASGFEPEGQTEQEAVAAQQGEFFQTKWLLEDEFGVVEIPHWGNLEATSRVAWVEPLAQGSKADAQAGEVRVRYAWWIEDLGGLLDLSIWGMGQPEEESADEGLGEDLGDANQKWGRKPDDLPLYALFRADVLADEQQEAAEDWLLKQAAQIEHPATAEMILEQAWQQGALVDREGLQRVRELSYLSVPSRLRAEPMPRGVAVNERGEDVYQAVLEAEGEAKLVAKQNLNALVAKGEVAEIAGVIQRYLPEFVGRRGAFPEDQDYLHTLAASLIDYSDADADASTGVSAGKQWRGVDSMPFVNECYLAYHWLSEAELLSWRGALGEPQPDSRELELVMRTFVELWNPSDKEISGVVGLKLENTRDVENLPGAFGQVRLESLLHPEQPRENGLLVYESQELVSLPPNGFAVLEFVVETREVAGEQIAVPARFLYQVPGAFSGPLYRDFGSGAATVARSLIFPAALNTASRWELSWNGALVDRPHGGFEQSEGLLRAGWGQRKWKGVNSPALDWRYGQFGDPRASWYIEDRDGFDALGYIWAGDYSKRSNWGGRADKRFSQNLAFGEVWVSGWPDGGRSSGAGWVPRASRPPAPDKDGSDARLPNGKLRTGWENWPENAAQFPLPEPQKAPVHIANYEDGLLRSVVEWGQVFDPAAWGSVDGRAYPRQGAFTEVEDENGDLQALPLAQAGEATPSQEPSPLVAAAGGGYTLAVGRQEFAAFDRSGWRASQLLDVFTLGEAGLEQEKPVLQSRRGKINLNSAPMEVLQVLFADLLLRLDPAWGEVQAGTKGRELAEAIVAWRRENGALKSLSQLNQIKDAQGRWIGEMLLEDAQGNERSVWARDALQEELFAQLYNCLSVKSENFRIHAVAEVYQILPNGEEEVLARKSRMRELQIEPAELDEQGLDQGGKREVKRLYDTLLLGRF